MYGTQYLEQVTEILQRASEQCDCLQSFFLIHSLGGGKGEWFSYIRCTNFVGGAAGTGSGIGTRILEILRDEFPDVCRYGEVGVAFVGIAF